MKTAIIGAGPAGLTALRTALDEGCSCDVFEKREVIGGLWNYNEKTGVDENGVPIHTTTYEGMSTNCPKELMEFENFPYKKPEKSYISAQELLDYIEDYAKTYNLLPHIQFNKLVEKIEPLPGYRWKLTIRNLTSQKQVREIKEYDAVVICIGNFIKSVVPNFSGLENFQGTSIHSFNYRKSNPYKNKKVLVVGSGASGIGISRQVCKVAEEIILSHRSRIHGNIKLPENIKLKPGIHQFKSNAVEFEDGTEEVITDVIFCTGYNYYFPFVTEECGIKIVENHIEYLYKQIINVKFPTMAFLGIPYATYLFALFGIQMRFFLAYQKDQFKVSKEEMLHDAQEFKTKRKNQGLSLVRITRDYYDDLCETANIHNTPLVYDRLFEYVQSTGKEKFNESYKILNEEDYEIVYD